MPSIRDFSGGVVNQSLLNVDNGSGVLIDAKNVLSSWTGELRKRTGTKYLGGLDGPSIVIPFRDVNGDDIALVFGDKTVAGYQYADSGLLAPFYVYTGEAPEIPNKNWSSDTQGDWNVGFDNQASDTAYKAFNVPAQTSPMTYYNKGGQYSYPDTVKSTPAYITIHNTAEQVVFSDITVLWCNTTNGNRPDNYKGWVEPVIQYSDNGQDWISVRTESKNPLAFGGENEYRASFVYGLGSAQKTENKVLYKVINTEHKGAHNYWRIYFASRILNTQTYDGEQLEVLLSDINFFSNQSSAYVENTDFSLEDLPNIRWAQNEQTLILVAKNKQPKKLVYESGNFTLSDLTPSSTTDIWTTNGFPACVAFYAGRLWFAGFSAFPTRAMASAFGNFQDFTIPETIVSTSPIIADGTRIKHIIENMFGAEKALYLLSEDGVSMIDAPDGSIVSTDMIEMQLRNSEPVNSMIPTVKDDIMIYLGRNRKKILITDYDFVVQRFKAQNISKFYDDFFNDKISELHYIPNKASLLYGTTSTGGWFALLFGIDEKKNGLFPFETNGKIYDIQPIKYNDETKLLLVIQRNGLWFLEEKMDQKEQAIMDFMSEEEKQEYSKSVIDSEQGYLDCLVKKEYLEPVSEITDLPYLSGSEIEVIADGAYLGKKTLNVSSSIGLYAWKYQDDIVYTNTTNPTTADNVFDKNGAILNMKIDSINESGIVFHIQKTQRTNYYAWSYTGNINITGVSGQTPMWQGQFNRAEELDYTAERAGVDFAWKQGDYIGFTPTRNPIVGESIAPGDIRAPIKGTINSVSTITYFTKTSNPSVGTEVYDSSFIKQGEVSSTSVGYIIYDSQSYYRDSDKNTYTTQEIDEYNTYQRSPENDISAQTVSLTLENPVKEIVLGYSYEAYAVFKFATPYAQKKYIKEISCYFINTGYLELGNSFKDMSSVVGNITETFSINNEYKLINGEYVKTLPKQIAQTPYVIVRSDKGLPFTIVGLDYKIDYSNYQGGV